MNEAMWNIRLAVMEQQLHFMLQQIADANLTPRAKMVLRRAILRLAREIKATRL